MIMTCYNDNCDAVRMTLMMILVVMMSVIMIIVVMLMVLLLMIVMTGMMKMKMTH